MKKSFKRWVCLTMSALFMVQMPVSCHARGAEDAVVWDTLIEGEEYVLDDFTEWKTGRYSEKSGNYESWSGRLCYGKDIAVVPGMTYRMCQTDNAYDVVVIQLDDFLQVLASDTYKNGGEITMLQDTAYVRIYIYNPGNYNTTYAQFEEAFLNGYSASIELLENYSPLLEDTDLTNAGLWEKGKYSAEKGEENTVSSVRLKDYKEVEPGTVYSVTFSATGCALSAVQLDENYNVLESRNLKDGSEYTMFDTAKYVRLSVTDTVKYNLSVNTFAEKCDAGLEFYFEKLDNYSHDILDTNLMNIALWESGLYSSGNGNKSNAGYAIRLIDTKICVPETKYELYCSNDTLRLSVFEYAADGAYIKCSHVKNGEAFITDSNAFYFGISLCIPGNYSMSYAKYEETFASDDFVLELLLGIIEDDTKEPVIPETPEVPVVPEVPQITETPAEPEEPQITEAPEEPESPEDMEKPYAVEVKDSILQLLIADDSYRVIVEEYDANWKYITSMDLGNLDYHYINSRTKYITMTMYQFADGQVIEDSYTVITEEPENFGIELLFDNELSNKSDAPALFGPELNAASTSNVANYRYGWYKSWGGAYEYSSGGVCSRNYYKVTRDIYYVNINDSRVGVSIREYDENGKWLSCIDSMYGGDIYIPSDNAVYVTLTVKSSEWATGMYDLLGYGLVIDFSDEQKDATTEIVFFEEFDFTDSNNWRSGNYVSGTGEFGLNRYSICTTQLLDVQYLDVPMMVDLWNGYLKMDLLELAEDGTVINTSTLYDGQKWQKQEETATIGISVSYDKKYEYSYYEEQWAAGSVNTLEVFEKYQYNTAMNPITAEEFMDIMNVGWNLGNSLDSHYGDRKEDSPALGQERIWGNITVTKELIDHIAELGFNTIRIPVTWYYNTYNDEQGTLRVHEAWFDRVQDVVDYAIANDMYVFLNTHHEQPIIFTGTDEETFTQVLRDAEDLWTEIATFFRDYDEHLIFEAYNEVDNVAQSWNYSATSAEQMNRLNQVFVDTVRATGGNNEYRILCAPTLLDGYNGLILGDYVKPNDPSGEGFLLTQIHTYSEQFDQDIEGLFASLEQFAEENDIPVIIGEFGTKPSYSPIEYRKEATANFVARANARGLRCIYWDDGNLGNYGLVNRKDFDASEHELLEALVSPQVYCSTNKVTLDSLDSFSYMSLNQSTGELKEDKYWGTIVTDRNGYGMEIPEGSDYLTLNLVTTNNATLQKIHYVHFYNADMQFISAVNDGYGFWSKTLEIPSGAAYVRVAINNSYEATKVLKFQKFFWFGEMKLSLGFIDTDDAGAVIEDPMDGSTEILVLEPTQPEGLIAAMEEVDFSDFFSYETGNYYYATGIKTENSEGIRIPNYLEVAEGTEATYVYAASKSGVRIFIVELDSDMRHLRNTELVSNKTITLKPETKYLAISLGIPYVNYEVNYDTYRELFEAGMTITFEEQE